MKKVVYFLLATVVVLFIVNCGGTPNTPAGIEKAMYSQLKKGNYEKAIEILFDNLEDKAETKDLAKEQMIKGFAEKAKQSFDEKGGIKSFEIVKETISEDGEHATVESKMVYGKGEEETQKSNYVKKDGKWYLVFGK